MEPSRDEVLFATLESLRPAPAQTFAAELDARAAAGFPRRAAGAGAASPLSRLVAWIRALRPRQLAFGGGAAALASIAIVTVVVAGAGSGTDSERDFSSASGVSNAKLDSHTAASPATKSPAAEQALEESLSSKQGYIEAQQSLPDVVHVPTAKAASGSAGLVPMSTTSRESSFDGSGPYVQDHRDVQRSAQIVLGTEPDAVGDAAGKVLAAVHDSHGIVLNSSVHGGSEGGAGAAFELLIPSAKLSDTLAAFSEIAEVRYRHEGTADITAPTESTRDLLQDSQARVESLLNELAEAETETEREVAETKLRGERRRAAALKSSLSRLERRADLSLVRLRIKTDAAPSSGSGGWDVGDAFHDAGHILAVAAGVAIVGLAVLGPLALIALLIWLANRAWVRQRRERALG